MVLVQPWLALSGGGRQLIDLRRSLVGLGLESARYVMPSEVGWPGYHRDAQIHEIDMGLELVTSSGSVLAFSWAMRGIDEGLAIELRKSVERPAVDADLARIDVSPLPEWRNVLGRSVEGTAVGWHVPNEGSASMPWSFRLDFGAANVVIALGEVVDWEVDYLPDSLVVIFDESVARSYCVTSESGSAWGSGSEGTCSAGAHRNLQCVLALR